MLLVGACCAIASGLAVLAATAVVLDSAPRLQPQRLLPRAHRPTGSAAWLQAEVHEVCHPATPSRLYPSLAQPTSARSI